MSIPLRICNATLSYQQQPIFADLHLNISAGQWVALLGPSGIGKSSLLRLIAGICVTDNTNISSNNAQIAYMGQTDLLLPWLTVLDNTLIGYKLRSEKSQKKMDALNLLEQVGLSSAAKLYPHQLSGGMRQRVALARTLMENKPIVLMDEPFSALDAITRFKMQQLAAELLQNKTILFVTHDPTEALRLAHEIYIMQGAPATLKLVATLTSATPRELTHIDIISRQDMLFTELAQALDGDI